MYSNRYQNRELQNREISLNDVSNQLRVHEGIGNSVKGSNITSRKAIITLMGLPERDGINVSFPSKKIGLNSNSEMTQNRLYNLTANGRAIAEEEISENIYDFNSNLILEWSLEYRETVALYIKGIRFYPQRKNLKPEQNIYIYSNLDFNIDAFVYSNADTNYLSLTFKLKRDLSVPCRAIFDIITGKLYNLNDAKRVENVFN